MPPPARRRLLGVLVAITGVLLLLDLAGSPVADAVRRAGGTVFGPVQRLLAVAPADRVAALQAENTRLQAELDEKDRQLAELGELGRLLGTQASWGSTRRRLVAARVVATDSAPATDRTVTLDVGARDGVTVDAAVLAEKGLVGRVVAVAPWTCDVQLLGSADSRVGVRVGTAGVLGIVGPGAATRTTRPLGTLSLDLVQPGTPGTGDEVTTLGSVGDRPYPAGVPVGTVVAVDPDHGSTTRSATVQPHVDLAALDVVAVVVTEARESPREATP